MSLIAVTFVVLFSLIAIIYLTSKLKLNAFVSLFLVSLFLAVTVLPNTDILKTLKDGFGTTMASIGFLIIFGAIVAIVMDKSGGALSIANYIYSKTGKDKAPAAMGLTGFIAGLPIFCDSGYIILSGLAKSFSAKTKISMPFIAAVMGCSLFAVHCLVPTHPGALAASESMKVNMGYFILAGILFAIPGALVAYFWIKFMTQGKGYKPYHADENEEVSVGKLPSVTLSLLPIVMPLILIAVSSLLKIFEFKDQNLILKIVHTLGQPVWALLIGVICSLFLLKNKKINELNEVFESAIEKAGPILIITAAGGMFGLLIKETGIGTEAGKILGDKGLGLLIPFIIAAFLKTAQGSSTVAIITAASFVEPMLVSLGLSSELGRLFATLAMGTGSMVVSHANDSYFWVVTKFSEIDTDVSLKVYTSATLVMGITVFICIWLVSLCVI
ncbi:GntP family permease [Apibacter raozihei]|uniref:GntP family permease n=1 Tax=Apibacter raozihei TaxID=2500547 RepID=UPI000FE2D425|nr:GntP family permease [Apibacter raozihei]